MNKRSVLIFAYYSYLDPVFQSAVLPYFTDFPNKEQYHFVLLTFEQQGFAMPESQKQVIKAQLSEQHITWVDMTWHSGRWKIIKKVYDLCLGTLQAVRLVRQHRVFAIYSEGFPGAVIAHNIARLTRKPHIVHTFEPHADYMVECGMWQARSWETIALKLFTGVVARGAYALLTATQAMVDKWKSRTNARFYRVPSCVDLEHFRYDEAARDRIRQQYGVTPCEIVVVYLGKLGHMYVAEELFVLFRQFQHLEQGGHKFRFMVLTQADAQQLQTLVDASGIAPDRFIIAALQRAAVPAYLSAADIAFCGIRPIPSRRFSSPIKNGEYWACGLPVIIPKGISDDYLLAEQFGIGWSLPSLKEEDMALLLPRVLEEWRQNGAVVYRERARAFVDQDRNVQRFQLLYHELFSNLCANPAN